MTEHVGQAERHVLQGEAYIASQEKIVAELERDLHAAAAQDAHARQFRNARHR